MKQYDIAAFVWPAYTGDEPRTRIFWPEGMGEWQTVRDAKPQFPGHKWPRKPVWGYVNEADPYVMEMEIAAAADHGVNTFIYDWYWFDNRPFLENCLNDGFLKARNNQRMKFYLMWANHDATNLWYKPLTTMKDMGTVLWNGSVSREIFEDIGHRLIEKYFTHPCYYKINNAPVFMIYDTPNLVKGLGGLKQAREAIDWLRQETIKAGFSGLHMQINLGLPGEHYYNNVDYNGEDAISQLGYESATTYNFNTIANMAEDYKDVVQEVRKQWKEYFEKLAIPYFPQVSIGWDTSPRLNGWTGDVTPNCTPENFEYALRAAKEYVDSHNLPVPLITINSWNEWTESSYLQPDDIYGYGYLEAVKKVFVDQERGE